MLISRGEISALILSKSAVIIIGQSQESVKWWAHLWPMLIFQCDLKGSGHEYHDMAGQGDP